MWTFAGRGARPLALLLPLVLVFMSGCGDEDRDGGATTIKP